MRRSSAGAAMSETVGSFVRIAEAVSAELAWANGFARDSVSNNTMPKLKMSERWSTCSQRACSGDMYAVVPGISPGSVSAEAVFNSRPADSDVLAMPKSSTFAWFRRVSMMFCGLMSRWTIPSRCASTSASAT